MKREERIVVEINKAFDALKMVEGFDKLSLDRRGEVALVLAHWNLGKSPKDLGLSLEDEWEIGVWLSDRGFI